MSEENVELARRAVDAVNRRDLQAFLRFMDEGVEVESRIVGMEGPLRGHQGVDRWWHEWFNSFPDYKLEIVEVQDFGDVLLSALRAVGHGAGSGVPFEDNVWQASRWRAGKCVWWRNFMRREEALEAAGLSE
jgi:ketosteroid isomerase-like protein